MTDTDLIDRMTAVELRVRELERLAYHDLADILNVRFSRVDRDIAEAKEQAAAMGQRLGKIEQATTMLQTDVRDLRNGMTAQFRAQGQQIADLAAQTKAQFAEVAAQTKAQFADVTAQVKAQGARLDAMDAKLDAILAKLGT